MEPTAILDSPYLPLVVWCASLGVAVQVHKLAMRALGWRHHRWVERTLPVVPIVLGVLTAVAFGESIGLTTVVDGQAVPVGLAAFYGAVSGFASGGLYSFLRRMAPEPIAKQLTVSEQKEGG